MILERVMFANDFGFRVLNFLGHRWYIDGHLVERNSSLAFDIGPLYASDALSLMSYKGIG